VELHPLPPGSPVLRFLPWSRLLAITLVVLTAKDVGAAFVTTVEKRVVASSDDAEEDASGTVSVGSSDLELIHDSTDQTVGMRWTALPIPAGATITSAYVQFSARESQSVATNLAIQGQSADNPGKFQGTGNISGRPRTATSATWTPVPWTAGEGGDNQKTPDLSAVVQEIVSRPGWASGNSLVMIVTGSGHRTAWSYDGNASLAPLLHVEYVIGPPPDNPPTARLAVTQVLTPPLTVMADGSASTDTDVTPIASYRFDFGDGTSPVTTTAPTSTASHTYAAAGTYDITLIATDTADQPSAPVSHSFTVLAPGTITTFEARTIASAADAEESATGAMNLSSSDLELVRDGTDQTVGMRWTGIPVPRGAAITAAYIQFAAKESQSEVTNLILRGEAADNAASFSSGTGNLSTRPRTASAAIWSPVPWTAGEAGANQRTPDISGLVQETVSRPGWQSGNSFVTIVTGTGHRTAWSYDGNAAAAPLLHIEFSNVPPPESPPIARLSVTLLANPPLSVNADASGSTDLDGTPIESYRFDFGDGTAPVSSQPLTAIIQHTYAAAGVYTITLTATDTDQQTSAPVSETVSVGLGNLAPNGTIDEPPINVTITAGQTVMIRGTGLDPDNSGPVGVLWDFAGGAANQTLEDPGAVTFHVPGTYVVRFLVADALGLADPTPDTRTITVNAPVSALADEVHWTVIGQNAVTFDWRGGSQTLHYGLSSAYGQVAVATAPSPIPFSSAGPFREAKLTGLAENTVYHYAIGNGPDHAFRTPPPRGASGFEVVAQGDVGASQDWPAVAPIQSRIAALHPDFVLMLGDLTYGGDEGQPSVDAHFNDMMAWSQDAAYQVAWGNHEWDSPAGDDLRNYKGRFDLPNPQTSPRGPSAGCCGEDWSWFDYGNVRFIGYPEPYSDPASSRASPPIPSTSCGCFPPDNIWNTDISTLPVHVKSADWVSSIGGNKSLDVAFGPPNYGMPWVLTDATTPKVPVSFSDDSGQSDPGPYPFRPTTTLEQGTGDKHAFMIDKSTCKLYELFNANWNGGSPTAGDGAIFDLASNALRPDGWTSADDAGLPIFPGLVRTDEIVTGEIRHAFRFTAAKTNPVVGSHLWPARFEASYTHISPNPNLPPMGARFRLKASFDVSGYSAQAQVILRALQRYGMMLSDIGNDWCLGGTYDPLWTDALMTELRTVPGNQFEAVDESSLMIDPNSAQARQPDPNVGPLADWSAKAAALMDAAQADPEIRFIVTFGHRPAYSSGFHEGEPELQSRMAALAAGHPKYVLNLNGHSHDYERSFPQNGVVHVTAGTGGSSLETADAPCPWVGGCPPPPWSAFRSMHHVVLQLRFSESSIEGTALCGPAEAGTNDVSCTEGAVLDSFTIPPDSAPVVTAPSSVIVAEGGTITIPIAVSDPDSQTVASLAADLSGLPTNSGATFEVTADHRNATLLWTPGFGQAGLYSVTFTASNALSSSAHSSITVSHVNRPPTAALVVTPGTGNAPLTVMLSAAGAADPDGDIAVYEFDFGDGSSSGPLTTASTSHTYPAGSWTAKVLVADAEAVEDSTTAPVIVGEVPTPNLALNGSFETDTQGWSPLGGGTLQTTAGGFDGSRSALVTGTEVGTSFGISDDPGWILDVPVEGTRYTVEAWVRSALGGGQIQLAAGEYLEGLPVSSSAATSPVPLSTSWQRLRTSIVSCCPGSQIHVQIVDVPSQAGESFELDDVSIGIESTGEVGVGPFAALGDSRAWVAPLPLRRAGRLHFVNTRPGLVTATLFDAHGRLIRRLLDRQWVAAGRHEALLDGRGEGGERLASGVYLYRVSLPGRVVTGRLLIVR
jgi:PKD repeat protein